MSEQGNDVELENRSAKGAPPGQTATALLLVVAAMPLVLWPPFAVSNLMALLGFHSGQEDLLSHPLAILFLITSTLYPLIWGGSLWMTIRAYRGGRIGSAIRIASLPLAWALMTGVLFAAWAAVST